MMLNVIQQMNEIVCERLWRLCNDRFIGAAGPFIPPLYAAKKNEKGLLRISEQETRFCFAQLLHERYQDNPDDAFRYSVETPTQEKYSFKGKGTRSAQTDLTLYSPSSEDATINIEFKCGTPGKDAIKKDIEKLVREQTPERHCQSACMFHLINAADRTTLQKLHKSYTDSMNKMAAEMAISVAQSDAVKILFTFCILQNRSKLQPHAWACSRVYQPQIDTPDSFFTWLKDASPAKAAEQTGWSVTFSQKEITR